MPETLQVPWRDYRTCSKKQRLALDFLTKQGVFAGRGPRERNLLYGGAGWGGKSHLLRTASFEILDVLRRQGFPNKWLTLYTSTYPNLADRHLRKFDDELSMLGRVRDTKVRGLHFEFYDPSLGGVYLRNVQDTGAGAKGKSKRGAESIGALIDESTELTYEQFTQIKYTTRPDSSDIPFIPTLLATNPDGPGHRWNRDIFVPDFRDLHHPFFNGSSVDTVFYIQALKSDNPAYAQQRDIIDANMAMIEDEDVRRARDEGAWDLYASGRFQMWRDDVHFFNEDQLFTKWGLPDNLTWQEFLKSLHDFGFELYTSLDYGTSSSSISSYIAHLVDPNECVWSIDMLDMVGLTLEDQAERIKRWESDRFSQPPARRYCDPSLQGRASEDQTRIKRIDRFRNMGLRFNLAINDRIEGAATMEWMLSYRKDANNPKLVARHPRWRVHESTCRRLGKMIQGLPRDPKNPEDVDPNGGANHYYDSARYFLHTRFRGSHAKSRDNQEMTMAQFLRELRRGSQDDNSWGNLLN